jgi:hypothetical protein
VSITRAIVEGRDFLRAITPKGELLPPLDYLHWRLGTIYGSFNRRTGKPRRLIFHPDPARARLEANCQVPCLEGEDEASSAVKEDVASINHG